MSSGQQWWDDHCDAGVLGRGACSREDCPTHGLSATHAPTQRTHEKRCPGPYGDTACERGGDCPVHPRAASRLRILCDADGVLVDFVGLVLDYVQKNTGLYYLPSAIDQWDCFAALSLPEHWPYFRDQCDRLQLCRSMRPMLGAAEFLAELRRRGDVAICTTPMTPGWLTQRAEWLEAFGVPLKEQIHCHAKQDLVRYGSQTSGWDILVDDKVENCQAFVDAGGAAFCITAAYNTHCPPTIPRGDWRACLAWLDGLR
jgi:5'(3')-deoxyribonucleotidase